MTVFTTFSDTALRRYLAMFGKGRLVSCQAIEAGIENSNYFVTFSSAEPSAVPSKESSKESSEESSEEPPQTTDYVLSIIEHFSLDEVHFFNEILARLSQEGLPVAVAEQTLDGMRLTLFCGKPAFLSPRLRGSHVQEVHPSHCVALGKYLGASHKALAPLATSLKKIRSNPYDIAWMQRLVSEMKPRMSASEGALLTAITKEYAQLCEEELPMGFIHGDLFKDNALFVDQTLTGVIDFYHACYDFLLQDLVITINAWCLDDACQIDSGLAAALIKGYESQRPLSQREKALLKPLQRCSAARFALTRFQSGDPPLKDPQVMLRLARNLG